MKKLLLTTTIILGLSLSTFAQEGSLFQRDNSGIYGTSIYKGKDYTKDGFGPNFPNHGITENTDAPLGSGIVLLAGLGAAYMIAKKRREE